MLSLRNAPLEGKTQNSKVDYGTSEKGTRLPLREGGREGGREGHQMPLAALVDFPQVQLVIANTAVCQSEQCVMCQHAAQWWRNRV